MPKTKFDVAKLGNVANSTAIISAVQTALGNLEAGHEAMLGVNPAPDLKWLRKQAHRVAEGVKFLVDHQAPGLFEAGRLNGVNLAIPSEGPLALAVGKPHDEATAQLGLSERELKLMGLVYIAPRNGVGGHERDFTQTWGEQLLAALWVYASKEAQKAFAAIE